jgi:molybdenum cofactor cytidylyltransferase
MVSAIVLAAGLSERMGKHNKLLLPYKGKPVIARVVENILNAGLEELIVVTGHEEEKLRMALQGMTVLFAPNPRYPTGMTSSIQEGIRKAKGKGYMICLSDMVWIRADEYALLKDSFEKQLCIDDKCICLPVYKDVKGNPVIFSSWYKPAILKHEAKEGCKEIVNSNKKNNFLVTMSNPHVLKDIDYPEDYEVLKNE